MEKDAFKMYAWLVFKRHLDSVLNVALQKQELLGFGVHLLDGVKN